MFNFEALAREGLRQLSPLYTVLLEAASETSASVTECLFWSCNSECQLQSGNNRRPPSLHMQIKARRVARIVGVGKKLCNVMSSRLFHREKSYLSIFLMRRERHLGFTMQTVVYHGPHGWLSHSYPVTRQHRITSSTTKMVQEINLWNQECKLSKNSLWRMSSMKQHQ